MKLQSAIILIALNLLSLPCAAQIIAKKQPVIEPITNFTPRAWLELMMGPAALGLFSNKTEIMVYNATPSSITIVCDDASHDLVGPNKYNSENPESISPWTYAPIETKGWDGYCKGNNSLKGKATVGIATYHGEMEKPGNFTKSRWIAIVAE